MSLPSVLHPSPAPGQVLPWRPGVTPLVIAHRGGSDLAPENTLAAFDQAVRLGATMLETDVQLTADGVAVAFHDETLDRVTDITGEIRNYTLEELRRATVFGPGGQVGTIPTMTELLDAFPHMPWAIDLKNGDSIIPLVQAINQTASASRVCVAHSWDSWLDRVRELTSPQLQRSLGWQSLAILIACAKSGIKPPPNLVTGSWVHIGWRPGGISLMKSKKFSDRLISMSHDLGMGVRVWTINKEKRMTRLLDQGVDGIFTDRPDLALELLRA
ncbi:MAG: glycerophosphodiester phosphodiesterase family protein [Flaviflexus sp.]|uniref:glycerophosphodiester phosphodiesterase family protein n=1 Tax=Flaviflexus sp. TaxID=1969482 RepID=UPI00352C932A